MDLRSFPNANALGQTVADRIEQLVSARHDAVIGWPSGRSTTPVLAALAQRDLDFSGVTVVMMDDYVIGDEPPFADPDPSAHYSCTHWFTTELVPAFAPGRRPRIVHPNARTAEHYDALIDELGGIDLFLAGIGASDGHVAFNPPGTPLDAPSRIVRLADSTRQDNLGTFPEFTSLAQVPTHGATVGLATVAAATSVLALAHGPHKTDVVARTLACDQFDPELPSTFLHTHPDAAMFVADLGDDQP